LNFFLLLWNLVLQRWDDRAYPTGFISCHSGSLYPCSTCRLYNDSQLEKFSDSR
jgi:hypothetical protein